MSSRDLLKEATARHQAGDLAGAVPLYQKILESDPENADAWHLMGVAAHQQGKNELAATLIQNAIGLDSGAADFHSNLGRVHGALGEEAAADADYRRAIEINPQHVKALSNLAGLLRRTGEFSAAVEYAKRAVAADPEDAEALVNLGNALKDIVWLDDAVATYRKAIARAPDYALAHWNLSLALLSLGKFEEGFREMEWRWRWDGFPAQARHFPQPHMETVNDLAGQRLLLHAEQGLGDTIQFLRYAPMLREAGAKVYFECPGAMRALTESSNLVDEIVMAGDPLPDFDVHAALLDLPHIVGTTALNIPATTPYISPPADVAERWQKQLNAETAVKIGLNWSGNPASPIERFRAVPPVEIGRLADLDGITWFNLQKSDATEEVAVMTERFNFQAQGPAPFVEAAGLISQLDLVITSDTAMAHLAGAMGKKVWILLHHAADWRWLAEGETSPWYPTARLFRQRQPGAWHSVIDDVLDALKKTL